MKALKTLIVAAATFVFVIFSAVLLLNSSAKNREASVKPLSVEELRELASRDVPHHGDVQGEGIRNSKRNSLQNQGGESLAEYAHAAPKTGTEESIDRGHAGRQDADVPHVEDGNPLDSADVPDGSSESPEDFAQRLRLESRPTREQIVAHIGCWGSDEPGWWRRKLEASGKRVVGSALFMVHPSIVPGPVGESYLAAGELEAAVPYLREATRIERNEVDRRLHCSQLAWLEEDPEVAAELVRQSCPSASREIDAGGVEGHDARRSRTAAFNGMALALVTESEELTEYVFLSYRDSWPQWLANDMPGDGCSSDSAEVRVWLESRLQQQSRAALR